MHAFGYLFDALVNGPVKFDPMPVWTEMQNRTTQGVYMGNGLLMPHARVRDISDPLLAIGICPSGISVQNSTEKATLIAMVLSPLNSPVAHTRMVGAIARLALNKDFMLKLLECTSSKDVFDFVTTF